MKTCSKKIITLALGSIFFSCNYDESADVKPTNEDTLIENSNEKTTTGDTSFTDEVDRAFFKQIQGFSSIYNAKNIIEDFNFGKYPMYYIQTEGGDFNNIGTAKKAFIINPQSTIKGAKKLGDNESFGLNIYRFDIDMTKGINHLKTGNGYFSSIEIDSMEGYYLQTYTKERSIGINGTTDITTAAHEAFHIIHQRKSAFNPAWKYNFDGIQDQKNFPFTKEIVELQILTSEILLEFPNITDKKIITEKMKQYIAIKSEAMRIDPSQRKLVKNMELNQERIEGGAYYVEIMAKREFYNNKEPFFGFTYGIPLKAKTKAQMKNILSFGYFYESGASVMYAINQLDPKKMLEYNTNTPFDIINKMLPMTSNEKSEALKAAKASADWKAIQEKAVDFTK